MAYTPASVVVRAGAAAACRRCAPIIRLTRAVSEEVDCLLLPGSLEHRDLPSWLRRSSKWLIKDAGLPVRWRTVASAIREFIPARGAGDRSNPGELALIITAERDPRYHRDLAEAIAETGGTAFAAA